MADIDLRALDDDRVVVHFGGPAGAIKAQTFANALIAFTDTARSVNDIVNPGSEIEILLEALGDGSFRAFLRKVESGVPGFFGRGVENLFWTAVGLVFLAPLLTPEVKVIVGSGEVIVDTGHDRIIVPRNVQEHAPNLSKSPEVRANVHRTYRAIEMDEAITSFGLSSTTDSAAPIILIPREDFKRAARATVVLPEVTEKVRIAEVEARLVILKAWLNHANRKWLFEWNGVPISAYVRDERFLDQLSAREYLIGAGDALDVILMFKQSFVESLGVYENDSTSYVVKEVIGPVPRSKQGKLG